MKNENKIVSNFDVLVQAKTLNDLTVEKGKLVIVSSTWGKVVRWFQNIRGSVDQEVAKIAHETLNKQKIQNPTLNIQAKLETLEELEQLCKRLFLSKDRLIPALPQEVAFEYQFIFTPRIFLAHYEKLELNGDLLARIKKNLKSKTNINPNELTTACNQLHPLMKKILIEKINKINLNVLDQKEIDELLEIINKFININQTKKNQFEEVMKKHLTELVVAPFKDLEALRIIQSKTDTQLPNLVTKIMNSPEFQYRLKGLEKEFNVNTKNLQELVRRQGNKDLRENDLYAVIYHCKFVNDYWALKNNTIQELVDKKNLQETFKTEEIQFKTFIQTLTPNDQQRILNELAKTGEKFRYIFYLLQDFMKKRV